MFYDYIAEMILKKEFTAISICMISTLLRCTFAGTDQLTLSNIDEVLGRSELVVINFYADWCHFSQMLKPIFAEMATNIRKKYPQEKVTLGTVDCERESDLAARYQISKYPTLKMFRFGQPTKREYRGQRSVDSLSNFIEDQLLDTVAKVSNMDELESLDWHKRNIIGYFDADSSSDYAAFRKVASVLRDDCNFHAALGSISEKDRIAGNKLIYRLPKEDYSELAYPGSLSDYDQVLQWVTDKCIPLVREITFQNAEELTEEGLPFVILFHHPDDTDTPEMLRKQVANELMNEKRSVNFLTADGLKFTHPLHHLGKTTNDLPVLAIDSFQHMYVWKHSAKADISTPGLLKQFIADLHSGKLHREFHNGPDPSDAKPNALSEVAQVDPDSQHYNVEHKVIMDSGGVRVQIMRVVKIGSQDGDPTFDFGMEIENLFRAMSGIHDSALGLGLEENSDTAQGVEEETITAQPFDVKNDSDQYWMNLVESNSSSDDTKIDIGHDSNVHVETTTTVVKATHKVKMSKENNQQRSSLPPRSVFARLAPSRDRYTILKEEL